MKTKNKQLPTALEYLEQYNIETGYTGNYDEAMIEFAKMHVAEALKQASENINWEMFYESNQNHIVQKNVEDSILNAYPLEWIK